MTPEITTDRDRQGFYSLKRKYSELYKRVNYIQRDIDLIQNKITEYDIRSANTSILEQNHKLKKATLEAINSLPGKDRKVIIGKMIKNDPSLQKVIVRGVIRAKRDLFSANLIQDADVLSIKNDAVFIIGRKLRYTSFGAIEFRPKHVYSLYMNIDGTEFYYDKTEQRVSVKGIRDEIVEHPDHQAGMMQFFVTVMKHLMLDRRDALRKYLIEFSSAYKEKKLPPCYYRELSSDNFYRTKMALGDYTFALDYASEDELELIDGVYNYKRFVLPLIQKYI